VAGTHVATLSSSASQAGFVRAVGSSTQMIPFIVRGESVCVVCEYVLRYWRETVTQEWPAGGNLYCKSVMYLAR
jgi:hypothetical protein